MKKLYYENQYIKSFKAEIINIKEENGKFHVQLDETAFFPGGGGQPSDKGKIESSNVLDVYEENGIIYHVLEKRPLKIHKVKCEIDWNKRFDGMQQHLAQHVLSGCFYKFFNFNTVAFHLGKEISTVDIEGFLDEDIIRKAELEANKVIHDSLKVKFMTPTKSELKKIKLRRALPKTNDEIRVVNICDFDINACCGVHPENTLELQIIKIKRWEKHKNATRIEFLAGNRAVNDYFERSKFANKLCKDLKCGEQDAINTIKKLTKNLNNLIDENKKIKAEILSYKIKEMLEEAEKINGIAIVKCIYCNEDIKYISNLATRIVEESTSVVLFAIKFKERANLIFTCSKNIKNINMDELLKDAITLIDGRGGGSNFLAQGGGRCNDNLTSSIEYALIKIKNLIE